jgi:hypothetical protein
VLRASGVAEWLRVHDRVAAADVAKDAGMVGARIRPGPGARRSAVWTMRARMGAVRHLARTLALLARLSATLFTAETWWAQLGSNQ